MKSSGSNTSHGVFVSDCDLGSSPNQEHVMSEQSESLQAWKCVTSSPRATNSHAGSAHEQGGLHPDDARLGGRPSDFMEPDRDQASGPGASGRTGPGALPPGEKDHSLSCAGHRNESQQSQEERAPGLCSQQDDAQGDRQRNSGPIAEGMPSQDLRDHSSDRHGSSRLWSPLCPHLRGTLSGPEGVCSMGGHDSPGGEVRLPPSAPGQVARGSRSEAIQEDSGSAQEGQRSCEEQESGLSRIREQLRINRDLDGNDEESPGGGVGPSRGTPSQEDRARRRDDQRSVLQDGELLSGGNEDLCQQAPLTCQFQHLVDVSQETKWESLPEQKARQLSFQANDLVPEAFESVVSSGRLRLLEVACSPESILTETMNQLSKSEMSAKRCSLFNGFDLSTNQGIKKVIQDIDQYNPEHVWMSPICGPYSVMQQVNQRTPEQIESLQEKRRDALKQYVGCSVLYTYCVQRGIHVTWEWSQSCQGWRLPFMQKLVQKLQPFFAIVRGCQVGLKDSHGQFISKGWKLMTTHRHLARRMDLSCKCANHVVHVKCEGSLTGKTAFYPKDFARKVCQAILQGSNREDVYMELRGETQLVDSFGNGVSCVCPQGKHHEANLTCGMCHHQIHQKLLGNMDTTHEQGHNPDEATSREPMLGPQIKEHDHACVARVKPSEKGLSDEEIKKKLYLLHSATGHGPVRHLVQALRRRGVDKQVLKLAENFTCPVCVERQRPKPRPVSTLEPLPPKWSTVAADMGTWEHPQTGETYQFLLAVDEGSRFRVGRVLGKGKKYHVGASQFLETFQEAWCQYFGLPDTLRVDPDGTFRSKAVEDYCDRHNVFLDIIPGEAHWKLGVCENAIKGTKELMTRLAMEDGELSVNSALFEATRTFNEREVVRGYSPIQHALGRAPDVTNRIFPRAHGDSPDLVCENPTGEFHRNIERMKTAEQAFLDWNNHQRLERAKHSRSRVMLDFQPGDLAYVWRQQVSGQSTVKGGAFVGPVRILALEHRHAKDGTPKQSSSVWCVRGRRLWKCSMEQLRHASERETILAELAENKQPAWDFLRVAAELGGNEYLDVSQEIPSEKEWQSAQDPLHAPWVSKHRCHTKRHRPVEEDEGMEDNMEPQVITDSTARSSRSRSPRPVNLQSTALSVDEAFFSGEHWWEHPAVKQSGKEQDSAFWCTEQAAVEISIEMPSTRSGAEKAVSDLTAFFTNSFKKRAAIEISEKHLSPEEKALFKTSKAVEVNNFISAKAFEVLPDHLKPSSAQAIRMRWILTWKYKENGDKKAKARAVLLGYQDPGYEHRATNSPTTTRQTRQLQLQLAASMKFKMRKGDVTGAFLQSRAYPGDLYCIPTPEICEAMGLAPESITKVKKACYGLVDAPLEWYRSVCQFFERLGLKRCWSDPCCWTFHQGKELQGIISAHVDDFLFSGNEACSAWMKVLEAIKTEYKWSDWEDSRFVQCGVLIEQHDDFSFSLSQQKYVEDLKYINLRAHRKKDRSSCTDEWEKSQLRTLLGGVSWHAQQVAPHFAAEVGLLLSEVNKSTIDTVLRANKLMDKVKGMKEHKMMIHSIPKEELAMYVWVDAGSQNRPDGSSTQGIVLGVASKRMSLGECVPVSLITWHSQKIERRCRSPGAAEALAAINGEDALYYGRFQLSELLGWPVDVRNIDQTVNKISGCLITDSRNVFDKLETETLSIKGAEKRTDLELLALKSAQIRNQVEMRWVHGEAQLSNGLTKGSEFKQLELFYTMGQRWRLVEDVERASARRRKALGLGPLEPRLAAPSGPCDLGKEEDLES